METITKATTWGQALDWQMKRWKRMASAKTNAINSGHITRHVGRSYPLAKMGKPGFWMQLQEELLDEGKSTSTVNRICSAGTHVLKETFAADLHKTNCPKFKRLKEGEHRLTWFSKSEVEALVSAAIEIYDNQDLADAVLFSAYTGVRQGELLKLKGVDVDLAGGQIWIGGKPDQVTKGKNVRAVPIAERIQQVVERRINQTYLFRDDWDGSKDRLYYQFKKIRQYTGMSEDKVWHTLRHSFGTWLGEVTHPRQIQALMGHADIETTLRYVKATDQANRDAIAAL